MKKNSLDTIKVVPIYDDYHEKYWDVEELQSLLELYLIWCKDNKQKPEIKNVEELTESNISHIAYHANLL